MSERRPLVAALAILVLVASSATSLVVAEVRRDIEGELDGVGPPAYELVPDGSTPMALPADSADAPIPAAEGNVTQDAPAGPAEPGNGTEGGSGNATAAPPTARPAKPSPTPTPTRQPAPTRHRTRSS